MSPRRIRFSPVAGAGDSRTSRESGTSRQARGKNEPVVKHWIRHFKVSLWIGIALLILFASNILFLVAFVTNGWGVLEVTANASRGAGEVGAWWNFGLWQCCRNDGFCLGTRWPVFYSATRALCVMVLFGQALSFAWMVGHSLEKLLDYDKCTMATLISLCYASGLLLLLAVITFGVRWPREFRHDFQGTNNYLSYSYYLAVTCVPLTFAAGGFATADLALKRRRFRRPVFKKAEQFHLEEVERKMETNVFLQKQEGELSDIVEV